MTPLSDLDYRGSTPHFKPTRLEGAVAPVNGSATGGGTAAERGVRVVGVELYFLPVATRVPLKFGAETLTSVTCARAKVTVEDKQGRRATGWGETPLSVQWVWPSATPHEVRHAALRDFCSRLAHRWSDFDVVSHPMEIGHAFQEQALADEMRRQQADRPSEEPLPLLAALVCCSPFDIALYDAYGKLHGMPAFEMLGPEYMNRDLASYLEADRGLEADGGSGVDFRGKYPRDYLSNQRPESLVAWHLVGGLDPITPEDLDGAEPADGHPVLLSDWIERDGLRCLKIKLRGTDAEWDYDRLVRVGQVGGSACHLTADFNCTVTDPQYVVDILDRLKRDEPAIYERILYIEQPFPYDIEKHQIDVRAVSERKLLLMDESAHNWQLVRLGRSLGWTGVALKTCKTLTGALLSLCWAKAHGMEVMVQDLTNPMLAQAPHVLLAAHSDTLMGVETNAMQFYPSASDAEAKVHPGLYQRRNGKIDLSSLKGPGFGYRIDEVHRSLPSPAAKHGVTA